MPKKLEPHLIPANWAPYDNHVPWAVVSSMDLSKIFGVHLQTINNWHIRGKLPSPVDHRSLKGNKNYYRISTIQSWLQGRSESEIIWEWAKSRLPDVAANLASFTQLRNVVDCAYDLYGLTKPNIRYDLAFDQGIPIP